MIYLVCALTAVVLLLVAATTDIALRIVPNFVCVALAFDGLIGRTFGHSMPLSLLAAFCVLIPAIVCWRHGLMGGGDAKLLAAVSLLVPATAVPSLVLTIALSGGALAMVYVVMQRLAGAPSVSRHRRTISRVLCIERYRMHRRFSIPYAVAISSGTLFTLTHGLTS